MGIFDKDKKDEGSAAGTGDAQQLAALKKKYQPVLDAMYQNKVQVKSVQVQNGKLAIRAEAQSADVKNKIWEQIKRVDATYTDLAADISVAPGVGGPSAGATSAPRGGWTYTVQKGDTLSKISKEYYGDANKYMRIFDANRDKLKDPDKIQIGQVLTIPEK